MLLAMWAVPAQAQTDFTTPVIERLEQDGFSISKVRRTLLGRILIVAKNGAVLREIVMNRKTGVILHDHSFGTPQAQRPVDGVPTVPDTDTPASGPGDIGGGGGNGGGGMGGGGGGGGGGIGN